MVQHENWAWVLPDCSPTSIKLLTFALSTMFYIPICLLIYPVNNKLKAEISFLDCASYYRKFTAADVEPYSI